MDGNLKIMIVGMGDLGGWVLELLARAQGPFDLITADANEDIGLRRTNAALLSSYQMGFTHKIDFERIDLSNIEETAEMFSRYKPDIICNTTTLQSWWVVAELPQEAYEKIDRARAGPWVPMNLLLTHKMMLAVKTSGIETKVINASFPDTTHPILAKIGLSPITGIGNIDNVIPAITLMASRTLNVHPGRVRVYLVAPHFVSYYLGRFGNSGRAPYGLRITVDGNDVTSECKISDIFAGVPTIYKRLGGRGAHSLVASSMVKIILNIMNDTGVLGHAPGPNGLPGGYPVSLSAKGVDVVVPPGMTLEDCIRINNEAQRFDGIEQINDDGSLVITDESYEIMKELLGYECKVLKIEECEDRALELRTKFKSYVAKFS